ncbi:hypothetical protein ACFQ5J_06000 [Lacticaseibacillus baoqingensis]|uniref:Uncharacterized protein n=1 Tax=Lacticaseibacillus baoqingensis TaxID=2486013 RepID=A0ABW4E4G1_9LACO|nr:hypothetical protein [Lacticaseibacillus baoqingensis]
MTTLDFAITGTLMSAQAETAYDLNGDTHHYDFTVIQVAGVASADPLQIVWPPQEKVVRLLFDGGLPFMGIHMGDSIRLEGAVGVIYTTAQAQVPPLARNLHNLTQRMISDARRWSMRKAGSQRRRFDHLTDLFAAEKLPFPDWLQKQTRLFAMSVPHSLTHLQAALTANNDQRIRLRQRFAQPVMVFVKDVGLALLKAGPLPHPPLPTSPPGTVVRFDPDQLHQLFLDYVAEAKAYHQIEK